MDYCVYIRIYVNGKSNKDQALREVWRELSDMDYEVDEVYNVTKTPAELV